MSLSPYLGRKRPRGHAQTFYRAPRVEPAPEPEPELPPTPEPMIDSTDPRYVRFADLVILPLPVPIPKGPNRAR
ncbi:MAG TPA: hypothetical protein VKA15_09135 [Isosphaeraceae bacterium]|nr:hypothetical protein [Isosphaeraceae bacterium]